MTVTQVFATVQSTGGGGDTLWTSPTALTAGFHITVFAEEPATSDQQWFRVMASRSDNDNSVTNGTIEQGGDVGGQAWSIEIVESADSLQVTVTGEGSHTINWAGHITYWTSS